MTSPIFDSVFRRRSRSTAVTAPLGAGAPDIARPIEREAEPRRAVARPALPIGAGAVGLMLIW
jgi:hypothetical protein